MKSQWADWLRQNASDMKGGVVLPAITRGEDYVLTLRFPIDLSDWAFTGTVGISPDAPASLASFTVSEGAFVDGVFPVRFTLSEAQVLTLPADGDGDGLEEIIFSIAIDGDRRLAGAIPISGKV